MTYDGDEHEYDDAETWAWGFIEGMRLCWREWQPLALHTPRASLVQTHCPAWRRRLFSGAGRTHPDTGHASGAGSANPASCAGHACPLAAASAFSPSKGSGQVAAAQGWTDSIGSDSHRHLLWWG